MKNFHRRESVFFAVLSRMKLIARWGLMRNTRPENLAEHSLEVAHLSYALALLRVRRFGGPADPTRAALLGLYHDVPEIFTGDLPTPVKYFNPEIVHAYKDVERSAARRMLGLLPEDLRGDYEPLLIPRPEDGEMLRLVKAADKLSALIKCIEEEKAGNSEFKKAAAAQEQALREMGLPEVDCFIEEFLPGYRLSLDELDGGAEK